MKVLWKPSPNFNARPRGVKPRAIVLHATAGGLEPSLDWLCKRGSGVSAHFVIAKDGAIYKLVKEGDRAWHAGRTVVGGVPLDVNNISIGYEIVNQNDGKDPYPPLQLASVVALLRAHMKAYPITDIWTHAEINPRKSDPRGLDVAALIERAHGER